MRYCGHFLIKAEGGAKNYKRDHPLPFPGYPLPPFSCSERDTYLITLIPRNITSQLQCISVSTAGKSAIPLTDE